MTPPPVKTPPSRDANLFLLVVLGLSWPFAAWLAARDLFRDEAWAGLFVLIPGAVGVFLALGSGRGVADLGFRRPSAPALVIAALVPSLAGLLTFAALVASGIDRWRGLGAVTPSVVAGALGTFLLGALGEEPGWRGFLLARYREAGVRYRWALIGVVWAAWHYPLILGGVYSSSPRPLVSVAIFTITVTAFGIFLGWLRETSESLWPPIVAHAIHNVWFLTLLPATMEPGPRHAYFAGESGLLLAAVYLGMALPLVGSYFQRSGPRSS